MANPTGLLMGAVLMLCHINQTEVATDVHNAFLKTVEEGIHTYDVYTEGVSKKKVGTKEFADEIISRLGQKPERLKAVHYNKGEEHTVKKTASAPTQKNKQLVGVDVFVDSTEQVATIQEKLAKPNNTELKLTMIGNRGTSVWPTLHPETTCVDQWRCRFKGEKVTPEQVIALLNSLHAEGIECIKTENLYTFDGQPGYSLSQDEQ
jgi:isocitrate dehydrogenase